MELAWFIPSHHDGRHLGTDEGGRAPSLDYLGMVARAADHVGFSSVLLPTGYNYEDAWVVASTLVPLTTRLRFIVALRPGLMSPSLAARMSATFDRLSDGRLEVNVVVGGDVDEAIADGQRFVDDRPGRYSQAEEFIGIWRDLLAGELVTRHGEHYTIEGARLRYPPVQRPAPPVLMGGSSPEGIAFAVRHVDTYLTWGEPPAAVAEKLDAVRAAAAAIGREPPRFGIRLHTVVRETDAEAWAAAEDLIRHVDDATIAARHAELAKTDSEGQRRMLELSGGSRDGLEVSPNLWAGVGLVRGGAGTALVGSPDVVAERILEYRDLGIDLFILSGFPHLEEAYRVAELLVPELPVEQRWAADRGFAVGGQVTSLASAVGR